MGKAWYRLILSVDRGYDQEEAQAAAATNLANIDLKLDEGTISASKK